LAYGTFFFVKEGILGNGHLAGFLTGLLLCKCCKGDHFQNLKNMNGEKKNLKKRMILFLKNILMKKEISENYPL